jgi:hypothetical protein
MIVLTKDGTPYPAHHIKEPIKIYDPRPTSAVSPYYYPLPSAECLAAIGNGDVIEVMAPDCEDERARIRVESADADYIHGTLLHTDAMDGFADPGIIKVPKTHIVEVDFATPNKHARNARIRPRRYLELCVVDESLCGSRNENDKVLYVYRDRPFQVHKGSEYPDSGWRILRMDENVDITVASIKDILAKHVLRYTRLGDALLWDDSWVHLIDKPIGSAFLRNPATGLFSKVDKPPLGLITPGIGFSLSGSDPFHDE